MSKNSKFLSLILRHNPGKVGLVLDQAGWAQIEELLQATGMTFGELGVVVETNDKKRFEFSPDRKRIRACQGHSVPVELGLVAETPPLTLYHGTQVAKRSLIAKSGLLRMRRTHVHLSGDQDTAHNVAQRRNEPTSLIRVWASEMHHKGFKFYKSTNGVWLTEHVPPQYLEFVTV